MADLDEVDKTLEKSDSGESENQTDESVEAQEAEAPESGKAADQEAAADSEADVKEEKPSRDERRHERYIDKLSAEIRASNDQSSRYTEEIFAPKPHTPLEFKDGAEYDPKDLEEDRNAVAANEFSKGVQAGLHQGSSQVAKELWADRFEIDSERVTSRWDDLNPDSEHYKPKLEATLVQKYIQFAGVEKDDQGRVSIQKPNVRFKDFVEAEMRNLEEYASERNAEADKDVKSQVAKTGLRPSGQGKPSSGGHGFDPNDPVGSVNRMSKKQYFELGGKEASDAYLAERGLAPKT